MEAGTVDLEPREDITTDYHGLTVADPYRPLEDPEAPATRAWVAEQNRRTEAYLSRIPDRERIAARLTAWLDYPRLGVPERHGHAYFFTRNDGLQNQAILYRQQELTGEPRVVLDPNRLSTDGTVALTLQSFSQDGTLLAYGLAASGSDWQEIRIREIATGKDYPEVIRRCKFASVAWRRDGSGFYYNRFPEPAAGEPAGIGDQRLLYRHRLGTDQQEDELIVALPEEAGLGLAPLITEDGAYLLLVVSRGTHPWNGLYVRVEGGDAPFLPLLEPGEAALEPLDTVGTTLFVRTDLAAPRGRILAIDLADPAKERWREVVPQADDTLHFALLSNRRLVLVYLHDAHHRIAVHELDGTFVREIPLPTLGSVSGIRGRCDQQELFIGFTSYLYPAEVLRYDGTSGALHTLYRPAVRFATEPYETTQVFATSRDGTRVPMFLTHKRGLVLDGSHPVLLYGYGGFNISLTPSFAVAPLLWVEQGGIYAVANLRGGGEYGEAWHRAGMLDRKQNVFDDFIACAEWLIDSGYTNRHRLAIQGGSNGGLLVAACMLQRPDLYGAVVCQVPVTDMLRYHTFTIGHYWTVEYGNAEAGAAEFRSLYAYSPLHNVRRGVHYPPILITSADTDDRVVPAHAKKFAATLQAAGGENPVLLRVETKAGHGAGKPISKVIAELADMYAFLFHTLGIAMQAGE